MAVDLSKWPLLAFMEHVNQWATSARGDHFWRDMVEHRMWADQLREEAKAAIVWLELRGQEDAAGRLDAGMVDLREAITNLRGVCEGVYPPENLRCEGAREAMVEAAQKVAGVAEDIQDEAPEQVWEGFPG